MIGGAARRVVFEFGIDKSLPEVRWLQDVHVAVEHFESVFGHGSSGWVEMYFAAFSGSTPAARICTCAASSWS
jgi:hypothetical protein